MMEELRGEYLASFDEKFNLMRGYFEGQDWYSLELEFHKLKGTGSTYGVPEVTTLCQYMEDACRKLKEIPEDSLNKSISLLQDIRSHYEAKKGFDLDGDPRFQSLKNL